MAFILDNVWSTFLIILFFGGSIFVHELGHFLAARRRGVHVERFSIGFGPAIWSWRGRDGVEYRLSWLPLGGYVLLPQLSDMGAVEGKSATDVSQLPPISYASKMIVFVAGAMCNVLFAFALACIVWFIGEPVPDDIATTRIGGVSRVVELADGTKIPSPAAEAGLRIGDVIRAVDGQSVQDWNDVRTLILLGWGHTSSGGAQIVFSIDRDGQPLEVTLHPQLTGEENSRQVGVAAYSKLVVYHLEKDSLADRAGIREQDHIVQLDNVPIFSPLTFLDYLDSHPGPVQVTLDRDGHPLTVTLPGDRAVPPAVPNVLVGAVLPGSPSQKAGLEAGDRIVSLDGTPVARSSALVAYLDAHLGPVLAGVQRGGQSIVLTIPAHDASKSGGDCGVLSFITGFHVTHPSPFAQVGDQVKLTLRTLASLLNPHSDVGLSKVSGPVGIVHVFRNAAEEGFAAVLMFTILLNVNLAIFNLLPIPILDGGHMLFATLGRLRGRTLPLNFVATTQSVFMVLLLLMMSYVTIFDVRRLSRDGPAERPSAAAVEKP